MIGGLIGAVVSLLIILGLEIVSHRRTLRRLRKIELELFDAGGQTIQYMGWNIHRWAKDKGFYDRPRTHGELLMLAVTELSEGMEWLRCQPDIDKDVCINGVYYTRSDHIPDFAGIEEELADTIIRILDYAEFHKFRVGAAIMAKMAYNHDRPHKHGKTL